MPAPFIFAALFLFHSPVPAPERHGGIDDSAFTFHVPASLLPAEGRDHDVRVVALASGFAWG